MGKSVGRPIGKLHQDDVRRKIQASALINVLQDFALGVSGDIPVARIKAIEVLLRKSIPDLSAVTLENSTDEDGKTKGFQIIQRTIVDPK